MAKVGRPKKIKSPEDLKQWFEEYKVYAKENPKKQSLYDYKAGKEVTISKEVPLNWAAFGAWLYREKGISNIDDYRYNDKEDRDYSEFAQIIKYISSEIWAEQYDGAAAGIYQHNIVARKLGLADKQEVEQNSKVKINIDFGED